WLTECGAYLRSSAPPACGNLPGLHPGNAPTLRRVAATAQYPAAGAATVRTLNAGRTCAAVRPFLRELKEHLKIRYKGIGNDCSGGVTREILRAVYITPMIQIHIT
ncbi:hypothetical protein, partial [Citrobacter freundii]|uniref:hypothetical protein n=1 Tax=Citrobacter freundii TaxID=546 RepID=UPI001446070E